MPDLPQKKLMNMENHGSEENGKRQRKVTFGERTKTEKVVTETTSNTMNHDLTKTINSLFFQEKWKEARDVLLHALARDRDNHWILARLSTTYYEEKKYKDALKYIEKASETNPDCPLVLWDLGGTYFALGKFRESFRAYRKLMSKGPEKIASDVCGEGPQWSLSLLIDCFFRCGLCAHELKHDEVARKLLLSFIDLRSRWTHGCIHSISEASEAIEECVNASRPWKPR